MLRSASYTSGMSLALTTLSTRTDKSRINQVFFCEYQTEVSHLSRPLYGHSMANTNVIFAFPIGMISLDIWPPRTSYPTMNHEKILIVLHGLAGGSNEPYVLDLISDLQQRRRECRRRGTTGIGTSGGARSSPIRVVVCNARGCMYVLLMSCN